MQTTITTLTAENSASPEFVERVKQAVLEARGRPIDEGFDFLEVRLLHELRMAEQRGEIEDSSQWEVVIENSIYQPMPQIILRPRQPKPNLRPIKRYKPSTPPDLDWESRMTPEEARWCWQEMRMMIKRMDEHCVDNFRAAQIWKSSQRRRFRNIEANGCCGSTNWVAKRWSVSKQQWDIYLLGFNYGH